MLRRSGARASDDRRCRRSHRPDENAVLASRYGQPLNSPPSAPTKSLSASVSGDNNGCAATSSARKNGDLLRFTTPLELGHDGDESVGMPPANPGFDQIQQTGPAHEPMKRWMGFVEYGPEMPQRIFVPPVSNRRGAARKVRRGEERPALYGLERLLWLGHDTLEALRSTKRGDQRADELTREPVLRLAVRGERSVRVGRHSFARTRGTTCSTSVVPTWCVMRASSISVPQPGASHRVSFPITTTVGTFRYSLPGR